VAWQVGRSVTFWFEALFKRGTGVL
jgi:hypothetical protein